jgi:hypothetical protein
LMRRAAALALIAAAEAACGATNAAPVTQPAPAPPAVVADADASPPSRATTSGGVTVSGRYRVRGLPSGEYRVFASAHLAEADAYRHDLLERFMESGARLTVAENGAQTLDLQLSTVSSRKSPTR